MRSSKHGCKLLTKAQREVTANEWPSVEVVVFTFNHANFIAQSLQSAISQDYAGPYSIRVHDDRSTDNTVELINKVIAKSPVPIALISPAENQYKSGIDFMARFIADSKAEYVAVLGGDDFWTDPTKVRRQVWHLQKHTQAAMCHHRFSTTWPNGTVTQNIPPLHLQKRLVSGDNFLSFNFVGALSAVIRMSEFVYPMPEGFNSLVLDDLATWGIITKGKAVCFVSRNMATYRRHDANRWAGTSERAQLDEVERTTSWLRTQYSETELSVAQIQMRRNFDNGPEQRKKNYLLFLLRNTSNIANALFLAFADSVRFAPRKQRACSFRASK